MSLVTQAIVLAAGEGRRLRPVTEYTPKPLIPFYGRPLLDWAVAKLVAAGVTRVAVNACHLADHVAARVAHLSAKNPQVAFEVSREEALLGTGGAVKRLGPWLTPGEPFYVLNADAIFAAPAQTLTHAPSLLVTREPTYAAERRLIADGSQRLVALDERGDPARGFTFCGFTLADPGLPSRLPAGPSCILRQGYLPCLETLAVTLVETSDFFADTGTPEALIDAHVRGYDWVRASA